VNNFYAMKQRSSMLRRQRPVSPGMRRRSGGNAVGGDNNVRRSTETTTNSSPTATQQPSIDTNQATTVELSRLVSHFVMLKRQV